MDRALIPQYLANVIAIARADDDFGTQERAAVDEVCAQVGGTDADMKAAEALAQADGFAPEPLGRFSDKVRNIEDMMYVSFADGDVGDDEIERIIPFIEHVGLGQEVVDQMVAEGHARVDARRTTPPVG